MKTTNGRRGKRTPPEVCTLLLCTLGASIGCDAGHDPGPEANPKPETYLGLTPLSGAKGFQLRSRGLTIAPGEDVEYCELAEVPGTASDSYYVKELELGNGSHSHHMQLFAYGPGGPAEADVKSMALGEPVLCRDPNPVYGSGFEYIGGTQRTYDRWSYPDGVGRLLYGGQRMVFNYHYYNTSDTPIEARSAANFHTADGGSFRHVVRDFGFINYTIDTPAHEKRSFTAECKFFQDTALPRVERHTHRWGTDFTAWYLGGPNDGQEVFTSHSFEEGANHPFPEPVTVKAGEGFRFRCDYDNTEDRPLRWGRNATDEMCNLVMEGWDPNDVPLYLGQGCGITHIEQDGIGRPGARTPTSTEVDECIQQSTDTAACAQCTCNACGSFIADCSAVPDCKAVMDCVRATGCNPGTCDAACADVIAAHASAYGMAMQFLECFPRCSNACNPASSDAGVTDAGTG